jgi:hypothetical protein
MKIRTSPLSTYLHQLIFLSLSTLILPSSHAAEETPRKFIIDRFGQSARIDYPGKIKSEEELKQDAQTQAAALSKKGWQDKDTYGGLAGSGEKFGLKKTGFFHVEKAEGRQFLVTPEGNIFFHNGVCTLQPCDDYTTIKGREKIYEQIPPLDGEFATAYRERNPGVMSFYIYNWIRKNGKSYTREEWLGQAIERLRSWGFNSAGAFTSYSVKFRELNFPYVIGLGMESSKTVKRLPDRIGGGNLLDPFESGVESALEALFQEKVAPFAQDPLLIGYFLGNEQHFEILPKLIPTYKGTVAAKLRLVQMLQEKYQKIEAFNKAWNPASPFSDFEQLKNEPLFIRTDEGAADMKEFFKLYLETYYALVNRVFRKYDSNHMLIGSRWTPGTASNQEVVSIAGKYLDVISINYYTYGLDSTFLKNAHDWSGGKAIILSEWYFSCDDQGLISGKPVKDQTERGLAYRNYIEQSASLPFIVGSEWFSYVDQSITGRFFEGFNGEGNNIGLVNVVDRPYEQFISSAKLTNDRIYSVMLGNEKPFAYNDPRFSGQSVANSGKTVTIPRALPGLKIDGTTTNWPGRPAEPIESNRLSFGISNSKFRGDFRMCWDDKNLYFYIQVKDATPLQNTQDAAKLWRGDAVELFIGSRDPGKSAGILYTDRHILLGATEKGKLHIVDHGDDGAKCSILTVKDVTNDGYVLEVSIPWDVLGIQPAADQELLFDVAIDNSDDGAIRKQQLVWNGNEKNSADRTAWGHARLIAN